MPRRIRNLCYQGSDSATILFFAAWIYHPHNNNRVDTSIPLTTTTITTTSLVAVTQIKKRDLSEPTTSCTHDHSFNRSIDRREELTPLETDDSGKFVDVIIMTNETTPAAVRRDAVPAGLSGFPGK
jgi:hypothetical protein